MIFSFGFFRWEYKASECTGLFYRFILRKRERVVEMKTSSFVSISRYKYSKTDRKVRMIKKQIRRKTMTKIQLQVSEKVLFAF